MSNFAYVAFDSHGREAKGILDVLDHSEAMRRLREMGYFPTKIVLRAPAKADQSIQKRKVSRRRILPNRGRVNGKTLCVFTRQMSTLVAAGMPLLRGLRILEEQERNPNLKQVIGEIGTIVEGGESLSEALSYHPKVFNRLYINMVKAGEIGGVIEMVLKRLADFMEKAQKIKGKIIAALFYPMAVIIVAIAIMGILMVFVVPRFKAIFDGLLEGRAMPAFTRLVLNISEGITHHIFLTIGLIVAAVICFRMFISTKQGRRIFDRVKLNFPLLGPVVSKAAISRFARTFGTLVSSGVPILQTLTIVKETTGNVIVGEAVEAVHESVKQGETITIPLRASGIFPSMVVGMIDIGEQTGDLPEMLMKIADNYDDEVDNAVASMTSLLEPIMIVFLAVIVGSIVIALFLPLIEIIGGGISPNEERGNI
jgi:type IV pilus assembly protein PilC